MTKPQSTTWFDLA